MKLHLKRHFSAFLAVLTLAGLIAACNSPMGMGPPVDTTAPTIFINTPADNEFIRGIVQGSPFIMTGSWIDDFGVKSLKFEIYNKTADSMVEPDDIQYQVDADGKWNAEITIPARVATADEYIIKVYALDSFGNAGVAEVNVRIDIIPPWVRSAQIVRHPVSGFNFTSPVYNTLSAGLILPARFITGSITRRTVINWRSRIGIFNITNLTNTRTKRLR